MKRRANVVKHCKPVPRERIGVFFDIENLTEGERDAGVGPILAVMRELSQRGTVVAAVACGNHALVQRMMFELAALGVRAFVHHGGPDAADKVLLGRLREEVPQTVDTVVISSGDHIFAPMARELRAKGKRVEAHAVLGCLSAELYRAVDGCRVLRGVRA